MHPFIGISHLNCAHAYLITASDGYVQNTYNREGTNNDDTRGQMTYEKVQFSLQSSVQPGVVAIGQTAVIVNNDE